MLSLRRKDIVCQQAVELVTDYLEGRSHAGSGADLRPTSGHAPTALPIWSRSGSTIELSGAIEPEDLTPEARQDLTDLYRRWRSE